MKVHHFKTLDSTNTKARDFSKNNLIVADTQTKGRGRHKRQWDSNKGGLWLSIVLEPKTKNPAELTFLAAVAVQKAIKRTTKLETKIKWPNDLLHKDKKLCGILTEAIFKGNSKKMIVGIGINVNNKLPISLKSKATSIKEILKKETNLKGLLTNLINQFNTLHKTYQEKGFIPILNKWKSSCDTIGKAIKVKTLKQRLVGKAIKVNKDCSLTIRLKNNKLKKIVEGDIFTV
ncbi:MAG: biotin--[acetyl-CoA-carboxylase] ligase [Candidatus Woesearchaeota archaeon]|jgi:BirA family biotin operon repressor/biotin-[acetyl-CoA-carboxylase] ligase|nr:biotin--[acetyl-CoA-carboxylase] ligase [Candidatus Woesearchaeota archaeon]MDP7179730.1 biotin--[acetyl-CoA-carboxylase] ligase [Candidatus Woesearchaeota archaeon]MDP7457363.1 biotin--[acetyl-CoA-carboxylase] ligase [Candidatus Woesearchaeota archaeon]